MHMLSVECICVLCQYVLCSRCAPYSLKLALYCTHFPFSCMFTCCFSLLHRGGVVTEIVDEQGRTFLNYAICCAANNSFEVS